MGRITLIEPQKKNASRLNVFVDGEFVLGVHRDIAVRFGLCVGLEISAEDLDRLKSAEYHHGGMKVALRYLQYSPRSEQDVRSRLQRSGLDTITSYRVIASIKTLGYLDDGTFAREFVASRVKHKRYGPIRLRHELMRHGVSEQLVEDALKDFVPTDTVLRNARALANDRWQRLKGPAPTKRKKMREFLVRRGYSSEVAHQIIREIESTES